MKKEILLLCKYCYNRDNCHNCPYDETDCKKFVKEYDTTPGYLYGVAKFTDDKQFQFIKKLRKEISHD